MLVVDSLAEELGAEDSVIAATNKQGVLAEPVRPRPSKHP